MRLSLACGRRLDSAEGLSSHDLSSFMLWTDCGGALWCPSYEDISPVPSFNLDDFEIRYPNPAVLGVMASTWESWGNISVQSLTVI